MSNPIPDHILADILKKLPVKTLLVCRCVSKSWNSLIKSPFFIAHHYTSAERSHLLVKCFSRIHLKDWYSLFHPQNVLQLTQTLDFPFTRRSTLVPFAIVGSVFGLLCLIDTLDCNLIIVWNPSIKRHVKLPMPTITSSLAFAGLGFDSSQNDFKVVRLAYTGFNVDRTCKARVEIWSLKHPEWRILADHGDRKCHHMAKPGSSAFFMNGSIHWLANAKSCNVGRPEPGFMNAVLLFDVEKEKFQTLGLPDELRSTDICSIWLSKFGVSLALVYFDNRLHPSRCVIWVMSEYGMKDSWMKMISTDLQLGVENKSWVREHWTNMIMAANGSELSTMSYELDDEYDKVFGLCYEKGETVVSVDAYTESLVLLDAENCALQIEPY